MPGGGTWTESEVERAKPHARLLTFALSYDDLTGARPEVLSLDAHPTPIPIGRAGDGEALGFDGRGRLAVPDRFLSTKHAVLFSRGGADLIRDEGSKNGTWVNGARVEERALADGDLIEVGHSLFVYRRAEDEAARALAALPPSATLGPTRTVCPSIAVLLRDLERVAPSKEAVLVLGETGSGKEMVATTVHARSRRAGELCAVDCGAIPESLFESTFFGHVKGAFTGAAGPRDGEIARAHGGTLFLDEIGNLSRDGQAKLLRVIETGKVTPVGGSEAVAVDVRWIAATNQDLFAAPPEAFREDLLRRLAGWVCRVPPLRERREDLGLLAAHVLREANVQKAAISPAAGRRLFAGELRGNVRELRQALRTAALLAAGETIGPQHLPSYETGGAAVPSPEPPSLGRAVLEKALEETGGNVMQSAKRLGTSARQLYRWIEREGIDVAAYRTRAGS